MSRSFMPIAVACAIALSGCGPALPPAQNYATISGMVVDAASGQAISGAIVSVSVISSNPTGSNGTFTLYPIPTGPYSSISAQAPNYQAYTDNSGGTLSPGQNLSIVIRMTHS